jgi:hypothetical protein
MEVEYKLEFMKTSTWLLRVLNLIAWASSVIGVIFIIVGLISSWVGRIVPGTESVNFFHAANSFFLCSIAFFVFLIKCQVKKE